MIVVRATSLDVDYSESDDCSSLQIGGNGLAVSYWMAGDGHKVRP